MTAAILGPRRAQRLRLSMTGGTIERTLRRLPNASRRGPRSSMTPGREDYLRFMRILRRRRHSRNYIAKAGLTSGASFLPQRNSRSPELSSVTTPPLSRGITIHLVKPLRFKDNMLAIEKTNKQRRAW
jgi:hypothetical protein